MPKTKETQPKCPFNAQDLQKWRQLLVAKRAEVSEDRKLLIRDAMEAEDGHTAPTHQADRGSDVDFQEFSLSMAVNEEEMLWQIDRAIRKIDLKRPIPFGLCEHTLQPIPKTRLKLIPWTPLSIDGANYMEEQGYTLQDMLIED